MVLILFTSFDDALYLYIRFVKISQRVSEILRGHDSHGVIIKVA